MNAIYARQSVEKKDSISIEGQIDFCRKLLPEGESYRVYADSGYSGKNICRPLFQKMMEDIRAGEITKVLVYKVDRISRAIGDFSGILEFLTSNRVEFVSATQPIDTTNPMGKAMLSVVMVFAQLERETIQQRVRDNYYERGSKGFYLGGKPPFGFDKIPMHLHGKRTSCLTENAESIFVHQIFSEYARPGISLGQVAAGLAEKGIRSAGGKPWSTSTLGRLLRNPVYVMADAEVYRYLRERGASIQTPPGEFSGGRGCYLYGQRKAASDPHALSDCFITLAPHQGMIPPETWLECQRKLEQNRPLKNSGKGTYSWLSGRMQCGYCGYALTVARGRCDECYISCGGRKLKICRARLKTVRVCELEKCVERALTWRLAELENVFVPEKGSTFGTINRLKLEVIDVEGKIQNLMEKLQEGKGISVQYLNQALTQLDARKKELEGQIYALERASSQAREQLPANFSADWKDLPFSLKKQLTGVMVERVTLTDETLIVDFL